MLEAYFNLFCPEQNYFVPGLSFFANLPS